MNKDILTYLPKAVLNGYANNHRTDQAYLSHKDKVPSSVIDMIKTTKKRSIEKIIDESIK